MCVCVVVYVCVSVVLCVCGVCVSLCVYVSIYVYVVLGIELMTLHMIGKYSTTDLHPSSPSRL